MQRLAGGGSFLRFGTQAFIDSIAWILAVVIAALLRYDLEPERLSLVPLLAVGGAAVLLHLGVGMALYLYRGRHPYGSFAEMLSLFIVVIVVLVVVGGSVLLFGNAIGIPRSTVFIAAPLALILMAAVRYLKRFLVERARRPREDALRTLIYGAGDVGSMLARRMQTDTRSLYHPVGIIDDHPARRHAWFDRVRVMGNRSDLVAVAERTRATVLVVAIARADAELLRAIADAAAPAGLTVRVLPPFDDMLAQPYRPQDLRDVSIEDLVGRHAVDTEVETIAGYLEGKRILVTGAGGSIGSELCRQIWRFGPSELIMLDCDETGLQETQISVRRNGLLDSDDVVLADIRDAEAITAIFESRRPQVVFHAAALKHLPLLEQFPEEAWKTNVLGTLNVLRAAEAVHVETFVNVSTDKAAHPTSVLGHSKRVAERLTAWASKSGDRYLSVRFGNVLGSRGSMIPTFSALIDAGGPLTITHPDATRYFMTIPESCQLVIQAGGIGAPGEVLILDMGEPVRIMDVAQRMIAMSGKKIDIVYTGLRRGEKLHEVLTGVNEDLRRSHPQIAHTSIEPTEPGQLNLASWLRRLRDPAPQDAGR